MSDPIRAQLPTGGASIVTDTLAAARGRGYRVERELGQRARMGAEP